VYRNDAHPRDIDIDVEEVIAAQRRLRKKQLVALGVGLVLLGGGAAGAALFLARKADLARRAAWERAATCIAGVGDGSPGVRARGQQLVAMGIPVEKRLAPGFDGRPDRCVVPLHTFAEIVKESGASAELAGASEQLATMIANAPSLAIDIGPRVDDLFTKAAGEKLTLTAAAAGVPAPERATPMVLATLPGEARMFGEQIPLTSIHRSPIEDETPRFVVDDTASTRGPVICQLVDAPRAIACTKVPPPAAAMSPALRLWGTTAPGVKPFVFAGDRGKSGIYRSDTGARVVDRLEYGAYGATALDDGSLGYLVFHESPPETRFVRVALDGTRTETPVVSRRDS